MAADDELFVLKNFFHLGCYQQAISESISAHPSNPDSAIEAKFFMYRAYIEQGQYRLVLEEVRADAPRGRTPRALPKTGRRPSRRGRA